MTTCKICEQRWHDSDEGHFDGTDWTCYECIDEGKLKEKGGKDD